MVYYAERQFARLSAIREKELLLFQKPKFSNFKSLLSFHFENPKINLKIGCCVEYGK